MQNFGRIKNTFNSLLVEGIATNTNENKTIFKKFIKTIKESSILKTQFNVYYDIEHKLEANELKSSEFVKESISLMNQYKKEDILAENKKLMDILDKHNVQVLGGEYPHSDLHENINTLIFTKRNSKTVNTIVESLEKVIGHVKNNVLVENERVWTKNGELPNSFIGDIMVDKFNERYADMTEGERAIVRKISEANSNGRKTILNELSTDCISLVNSKISESNDLSEKEALLNVKEVLLTLEYADDTFMTNVGRIIELKKALDV